MQSERKPESLHHPIVENPKVVSLLGSVGLTALDQNLFNTFREIGFPVFVHGSLMESRIGPSSDIDFTVIGNPEDMPSDIRDTIMPRYIAATAMKDIAYTSTSQISHSGRKMSLHVSNPDFRRKYATDGRAIASEYRPAQHAKKGDRSYFLSSMDEENNIYLINFGCSSEMVNEGQDTITPTPQTGRFIIDGESIYTSDDTDTPAMAAKDIIRIAPNGTVSRGPYDKSFEVMALGLEFDKMQSDTPLYSDSYSNGEYEQFVLDPIKRSLNAVGEYADMDAGVAVKMLFDELATYWPKIKPNKTRKR